jgi:predicted metal-dependent hydrolase
MLKDEYEVELNEKDLEEIREQFQDFLTEIPEDYLIERAKEIESELDINPDEVPEYTDTDLDDSYSKLMELVGKD